MNDRAAGVLLHVTSLHGRHGCGDFGPEAYRFVDFLHAGGQRWWQVLPIHTPNLEASPYNAITAFAGNPFLISLEVLAEEGFLSPEDVEPRVEGDRVDFAQVWRFKFPLFQKAFQAFETRGVPEARAEFEEFCEENASWLDDYALFAALRESKGQAVWTTWDTGLRRRVPAALEAARRRLAGDIRFQKFLQYVFWSQWDHLKRYCASQGVGVMGDVAFFVAHDSADVWAHQDLFELDGEGWPAQMGGTPPDFFSPTGQLWGNPIYRWDAHRAQDFDWWTSRLESTLRRFDAARLDHFLGFYQCWAVPGGSSTAENGRYILSPGGDILERVKARVGDARFVAEDLAASVPQGCVELRERFGLPTMRVLHFGFGPGGPSDYHQPHTFPRRCLAYTGTHDNDTTVGWLNSLDGSIDQVLSYVGKHDRTRLVWDLIALLQKSPANTAMIPMQDFLGLGTDARMNRPGVVHGNWIWKMGEDALTEELAAEMRSQTAAGGRLARQPAVA